MPLRDIGVAFGKMKIERAWEGALRDAPDLLVRVRDVQASELSAEKRETIGAALYRRSKELIQSGDFSAAVQPLSEAHRFHAASALYVSRLQLLKELIQERMPIPWQVS